MWRGLRALRLVLTDGMSCLGLYFFKSLLMIRDSSLFVKQSMERRPPPSFLLIHHYYTTIYNEWLGSSFSFSLLLVKCLMNKHPECRLMMPCTLLYGFAIMGSTWGCMLHDKFILI